MYSEAKTGTIPKTISSVFSGGNIELTDIALLAHHVLSLIFFMSASTSEQWTKLNFADCSLRSIGMISLLEHVIKTEGNVSTLEYVDLSGNDSSPWGVYCVIIRHCKGNSLTLCGDDGIKEHFSEITHSLEANPKLTSLKLCKIQNTGLFLFMNVLCKNTTLFTLDISQNNITDDEVVFFVSVLEVTIHFRALKWTRIMLLLLGQKDYLK